MKDAKANEQEIKHSFLKENHPVLMNQFEIIRHQVMKTCKIHTEQDFEKQVNFSIEHLFKLHEKINQINLRKLDPVPFLVRDAKNKLKLEDKEMDSLIVREE